jgi:AcrR family transcriptional regulator
MARVDAVTRHRTASTEIESKILAAALTILDTEGESALTVRGIATTAGIAPMGIYSRFDGKTGVFEALFIEGFDRLADELDQETPTSDAGADLVSAGHRYRAFAQKNPAHYRLMFMSRRREYTPSPDAANSCGRTFQRLINLIERAQRERVLPPEPSIDLAQTFWSAVHGFVALELSDMMFATDADRAFDTLLRSYVAGLRMSVPAH